MLLLGIASNSTIPTTAGITTVGTPPHNSIHHLSLSGRPQLQLPSRNDIAVHMPWQVETRRVCEPLECAYRPEQFRFVGKGNEAEEAGIGLGYLGGFYWFWRGFGIYRLLP